jgi:hypothetical protein
MSIHTADNKLNLGITVGCTKKVDEVKELIRNLYVEKKLIISYDDIAVNTTIAMNKHDNNREEIKKQVISSIRHSWVYGMSILRSFRNKDGDFNKHRCFLEQLVYYRNDREYLDIKAYVIRELCGFLIDYLEAVLGMSIEDILSNFKRVSFTELVDKGTYLNAAYIEYVVDDAVAQLRNGSIEKKLRHSKQPAEIVLRNDHVIIKTFGLLLVKERK